MKSYKIHTGDVYYVVGEESALSESDLLKLAEEIRTAAKIIHPNFLIDMRYDYQLVQLQALQKISEQLQPVIKGNLDGRTTLFIPAKSADPTSRQEVEIVLPLQSFGWPRQHYARLRKALFGLSTIHVCYPKWSHRINKTLFGAGPLCTYVAIHRDEKDKRRELVHFFFSPETASCLVNPQYGFTKLLRQTLQTSKNVYTTKIYIYISRVADLGKWVVSYKKLREILCVGKKFPRYYDFRSRVLKEAEQQLRHNSNHWFDLVECFKKGDSAAPQFLIFNIYSTVDTNDDWAQAQRYKEKIFETLTTTFKIKKSIAQSVLRQINHRNAKYIWQKHNMIISYMALNGESIQDINAYYLGAIQQVIQTEKYSQPTQQLSLF